MSHRPAARFYLAAAALLVLSASPARAHEVFGVTGFPAAVLHPLVIIDQALALTAAGLIAGQQPRPALGGKLLALLLAMLAGFAVLLYLPDVRLAPLLPLAAAGICGSLVAAAPAFPAWACALAIALPGFAVGLNTIPEAGILMAFLYAIGGAMIGAGALLLVMASALSRLTRDWQRLGLRILGSWIAASAILVLAMSLGR